MSSLIPFVLLLLPLSIGLFAQDSAAAPAVTEADAESETDAKKASQKPQRILAILPNYRTADANQPFSPLTAKEKLDITRKDSFDYPVFFTTGAFAAMYQFQDRNPSYGQGMAGYGRRYGSAFADQTISNFLSEGIFPAAFHADPRYFRLGASGGGTWKRMGYALTRIAINRNDKGKWTFNYSEFAGVGAATAISNFYYPEDTRDVKNNLEKMGFQLGGDAFYNVLREFWPDLSGKLFGKK